MADVEALELKIVGNASGATKSLNTLIKTLEKLEQATAGGCGLGSVAYEMSKFQNVSIGLSSVNKSSGQSFVNLAAKVGVAGFALKKVGSAIASWINESNEYVENLNLFTVSMGDYAEAAQTYAENVGDLLGIDPSEWMRNQGVFMTMATGFGVVGERASTMSQQLTQLGYDISSFYNTSVEEAMQRLQSGLAGELEPLRRLGYDLSQAKLEATALSLGIDKAVSSMTQAEKAELRYYAIMTQVTQVHGDMADTLTAPANQLRIFKAQVDQAARSLGNVFIPALNMLLPYGIAAVKVFRVLADAIAAIVGFTLPEVSDRNVGTDVAEGFEEANEEIAKMKKTLLGIDELNVLGDNSSSDVSSGTGFDFELPTYDFIGEATESRINQIVEEMKDWLGISEDINSWSDLLDTRLGDILTNVGLIGLGIAAWKVTTGFMSAISTLKGLLANPAKSIAIGATLTITGISISFSGMKDAIERGLDGFNFAEIIGGGLLAAGGAALLGTKIAAWITTAFAGSKVAGALTTAAINLFGATTGPITAGAVAATGGVLLASGVAIIAGIGAMFVGIYDAITTELDWLNGTLIAAGATAVGAGIGMLIGGPMGALVGAGIGLAVGAVTDAGIWITQNVEDTISQITGIVGGASLALGAILALTGVNVPLGLGLMAAGAVAVGSVIAMNASSLSDEVQGTIAVITTCVSGALLALGAVLAFTGANIPLGIGLMVGGAMAFGGAVAPQWNTLSDGVKKTISIIMAALGGALLVIGAILAFTGVGLPLGIGLMVAGAASLGASVALNWNAVKNSIKSVLASILAVLSGASLVLGVLLCLTGAGLPLGLSLIMSGIAGSVTAAKLDDNPITRFVKKMANTVIGLINMVIDAVNGLFHIKFKGLKIGGVELIPSIDTKLINLSKIPLMAEGGLVNDGQMFIAREAGPELVGSIGNKTAVANNDQIVSAVSKGVYQAVVQAMGQSGNQTVEAKVNDRVLFEVVVNRARQETMRTGYNPLLGGV